MIKDTVHDIDTDDFVALVKKGSVKAFKTLYDAYYSKICSYANSYLHNNHVAEEICQDVFLYLWEKREYITDNTHFLPYLLKITRNKCLNHLKASRLRPISVGEWDSSLLNLDLMALEDKSSDQLLVNELSELIDEVVESMPDNCRETFLLSRDEGLKYWEISEQIGVPVKTIEWRMSKSLKMLREKLSDYMTVLL